MNLNQRIQKFYDASTPLWLNVWGEHMHHGHYGVDGMDKKDRIEAQTDMIEALLEFGDVMKAYSILDAGCGVGGSARYLSKKFDAQVLGMTLSSIQVLKAREYTARVGLEERVHFEQRDMMSLNDGDGSFDLIWSMESAEHISDKQLLFDLFYNRLRPGGKLIMATWCHRETPTSLNRDEIFLLQKIYNLYHLPPMVSISSLARMASQSGFQTIKTEDWSMAVAPFWDTVIQSALTWQGIRGLLQSGISTMKGAWAMKYMKQGFENGLINFGVLTCEKEEIH